MFTVYMLKMSCLHYKFKSSLDYETLTFDGLHISVKDLKNAIYDRHKIGKGTDFDLAITNAQTKDTYDDEKVLIPRNSSVIVARVPVQTKIKNPKVWDTRNEGSVVKAAAESLSANISRGGKQSSSLNLAQSVTKIITGHHSANHGPEGEDAALRQMMMKSTEDYDASKYVQRNALMTGAPPPTYICNKCGQGGHWIKNCPTLAMRRTTGIPRHELQETDASNKNAMLGKDGKYMVHIMHHDAYRKGRVEKPIDWSDPNVGGSGTPTPSTTLPVKLSLSHQDSSSGGGGTQQLGSSSVPAVYLCPLCNDLLREAVLAPCCGKSFCDECIRERLLESDVHQCPLCGVHVSPNDLHPNISMREAVANHTNGHMPPRKTKRQTVVSTSYSSGDKDDVIMLEDRSEIQAVLHKPAVSKDSVSIRSSAPIISSTANLATTVAAVTLPPVIHQTPVTIHQTPPVAFMPSVPPPIASLPIIHPSHVASESSLSSIMSHPPPPGTQPQSLAMSHSASTPVMPSIAAAQPLPPGVGLTPPTRMSAAPPNAPIAINPPPLSEADFWRLKYNQTQEVKQKRVDDPMKEFENYLQRRERHHHRKSSSPSTRSRSSSGSRKSSKSRGNSRSPSDHHRRYQRKRRSHSRDHSRRHTKYSSSRHSRSRSRSRSPARYSSSRRHSGSPSASHRYHGGAMPRRDQFQPIQTYFGMTPGGALFPHAPMYPGAASLIHHQPQFGTACLPPIHLPPPGFDQRPGMDNRLAPPGGRSHGMPSSHHHRPVSSSRRRTRSYSRSRSPDSKTKRHHRTDHSAHNEHKSSGSPRKVKKEEQSTEASENSPEKSKTGAKVKETKKSSKTAAHTTTSPTRVKQGKTVKSMTDSIPTVKKERGSTAETSDKPESPTKKSKSSSSSKKDSSSKVPKKSSSGSKLVKQSVAVSTALTSENVPTSAAPGQSMKTEPVVELPLPVSGDQILVKDITVPVAPVISTTAPVKYPLASLLSPNSLSGSKPVAKIGPYGKEPEEPVDQAENTGNEDSRELNVPNVTAEMNIPSRLVIDPIIASAAIDSSVEPEPVKTKAEISSIPVQQAMDAIIAPSRSHDQKRDKPKKRTKESAKKVSSSSSSHRSSKSTRESKHLSKGSSSSTSILKSSSSSSKKMVELIKTESPSNQAKSSKSKLEKERKEHTSSKHQAVESKKPKVEKVEPTCDVKPDAKVSAVMETPPTAPLSMKFKPIPALLEKSALFSASTLKLSKSTKKKPDLSTAKASKTDGSKKRPHVPLSKTVMPSVPVSSTVCRAGSGVEKSKWEKDDSESNSLDSLDMPPVFEPVPDKVTDQVIKHAEAAFFSKQGKPVRGPTVVADSEQVTRRIVMDMPKPKKMEPPLPVERTVRAIASNSGDLSVTLKSPTTSKKRKSDKNEHEPATSKKKKRKMSKRHSPERSSVKKHSKKKRKHSRKHSTSADEESDDSSHDDSSPDERVVKKGSKHSEPAKKGPVVKLEPPKSKTDADKERRPETPKMKSPEKPAKKKHSPIEAPTDTKAPRASEKTVSSRCDGRSSRQMSRSKSPFRSRHDSRSSRRRKDDNTPPRHYRDKTAVSRKASVNMLDSPETEKSTRQSFTKRSEKTRKWSSKHQSSSLTKHEESGRPKTNRQSTADSSVDGINNSVDTSTKSKVKLKRTWSQQQREKQMVSSKEKPHGSSKDKEHQPKTSAHKSTDSVSNVQSDDVTDERHSNKTKYSSLSVSELSEARDNILSQSDDLFAAEEESVVGGLLSKRNSTVDSLASSQSPNDVFGPLMPETESTVQFFGPKLE